MFLGQSIPACGFSLGLERILVIMGERGMFPASLAITPADVMVAVFDAADMPHAMRVAGHLRSAGLRVLVYPDPDKIGKQISTLTLAASPSSPSWEATRSRTAPSRSNTSRRRPRTRTNRAVPARRF